MGVRGGVLAGIAAVAVAGLTGQSLLGVSARSERFETLAMYGVGGMPLVDGVDHRDRYEVAVDHAALLTAAAESAATDATQDTADARDSDGFSANDRYLVGDLGEVGWGGLLAIGSGRRLARPTAAAGTGRVAVDAAVRDAFEQLASSVEEVNPVGGNRYELVGRAMGEADVAAIPGVVGVQPVGLVEPFVTDDPYVEHQWGLVNDGDVVDNKAGVAGVDVGLVGTVGLADGSGVVVAVIDSGVDPTHPDLAGQLWTNDAEVCDNRVDDDDNGYIDDCDGWDFARGDNTPYDLGADNVHGTHVAGLIAARTGEGAGIAALASGARIMSLKVFDGGAAPDTRVTAAIEYAIDNGAHVINLSLGGSRPSASMFAAISRAQQSGVLVVAAAGNTGGDYDKKPRYPASYDLDNVIAVGSHGNDSTISKWSNHGATSVDVFAPGEHVLSAIPGNSWAYMSGTSMAAPMVSAVAAVAAQSWDTRDAAQIRDVVLAAVVTDKELRGRAVTEGRVSAPLALNPDDVPLGVLAATVQGSGKQVPNNADMLARVGLPGAVEAGAHVDLQLARIEKKEPYAVLEHRLVVTVGGVSTMLTTNEKGMIDVPALTPSQQVALEEGTLELVVDTYLPKGDYALVIHATTATRQLVEPVAVFLDVHQDPKQGETWEHPEVTEPAPDADAGSPAPEDDEPVDDGTPPPTEEGTPPPTDDGTDAPVDGGPDGGSPGAPQPDAPGDDAPTTGDTPTPGGGTPAPGAGDPATGGDAPAPGAGTPTPQPDDGGGATSPPPGDEGGTPGTGGGERGPDRDGPGGVGGGDGAGEPPAGTSVWPASGPASGGTWLTVDGTFDPSEVYYVRIGDQVHAPDVVTTWSLGLTTKASMPGLRDVVVSGAGEEILHPAAYTYVAEAGGGEGRSDAPAPDAPDGDTPDGDTPEGDAPDGNAPEGDAPDGNAPEGDAPEAPGGDAPGDAPDAPGSDGGDDGEREVAGPDNPLDGRTRVEGAPRTLKDGMRVDRIIGGPLAGLTKQQWQPKDCDKRTRTCTAVALDG